ncbi:hypothetical protein GCM10020331_081200 [Ectobacillus funiculus]
MKNSAALLYGMSEILKEEKAESAAASAAKATDSAVGDRNTGIADYRFEAGARA